MANQEFPLIALHSGATLLGDTLMPRFRRHAAVRPKSGATKPAGPSFFERLDAWFWRQRQSAHEAYLAQAGDVFEVERRIRALERSVGSKYY